MDRNDVLYIINNDTKVEADGLEKGSILQRDKDKYLFQYKGVNYEVNLLKVDGKTYTLKAGGYTFTVEAKDNLDLLIDELGFASAQSQKMDSIKAPMPGLVLSIDVEVGQEIHKGDNILVLEAMKMENILKAEGDGVVKSILVKKGDTVDKSQLLVELE